MAEDTVTAPEELVSRLKAIHKELRLDWTQSFTLKRCLSADEEHRLRAIGLAGDLIDEAIHVLATTNTVNSDARIDGAAESQK